MPIRNAIPSTIQPTPSDAGMHASTNPIKLSVNAISPSVFFCLTGGSVVIGNLWTKGESGERQQDDPGRAASSVHKSMKPFIVNRFPVALSAGSSKAPSL